MKAIQLPFLIVLSLFSAGCGKSAEGLYSKVESQTGFELKVNPEGTDERTQSVVSKFAYTSENLEKADEVKEIIDAYTGLLPTVEKKREFDGDLKDYYEWEDSEKKVLCRIRYSEEKGCTLLIFYTEK